MNRTPSEMLNCLNTSLKDTDMNMSVLERQRALLKWQQEQLQLEFNQQQQCYFSEFDSFPLPPQAQAHTIPGIVNGENSGLNHLLTQPVKPDQCVENGWPDFRSSGITSDPYANSSSHCGPNFAISRTISCPPAVAAAAEAKGKEILKKRKAEKNPSPKVDAEEQNKPKRAKEGDKISNNNNSSSSSNKGNNDNKNDREVSGCTSKENSKVTEVQKPDFIHVRARRGQATDSHSLAERVRREKISERMKYLQDLVPGCNKITGKAGMLDEIINYVQSLQRQVEFLSMKLAAVNPRLDFSIEDLFAKEAFQACPTPNFPAMGVTADMGNQNYLQYNTGQQWVTPSGPEVDMGLRRSISAPLSIPDGFLDSSCFTQQIQSSLPWDADLQNIFMDFQQPRPSSFPSQTFAGPVEGGSLKLEM